MVSGLMPRVCLQFVIVVFPDHTHYFCVICNSNIFHFFIFKLCIMIVHTLKCAPPILCTFDIFLYLKGVEHTKIFKLLSCQKVRDALHYLLDNIFIRFGSKLYRQIVGIPMGTNCFCFDMRETSCCLFLTIIKQMLSKHFKISR